MIAALTGLFAGFIHVLAGPDHLAAIAPYSVESRRGAWRVGLSWGVGHAGGVLLVALLAFLLRGILPIERLSGWSERLVGAMLIVIGLWSVRSALRNRVHSHRHRHGSDEHVHVHVHPEGKEHDSPSAHIHTHAAFAIGSLHGLAGSSHLFGVLPALALPTQWLAGLYLIAFATGTVLAMTGFSTLLGLVAGQYQTAGNRIYRGLMGLSGAGALVVGCFWIVQ